MYLTERPRQKNEPSPVSVPTDAADAVTVGAGTQRCPAEPFALGPVVAPSLVGAGRAAGPASRVGELDDGEQAQQLVGDLGRLVLERLPGPLQELAFRLLRAPRGGQSGDVLVEDSADVDAGGLGRRGSPRDRLDVAGFLSESDASVPSSGAALEEAQVDEGEVSTKDARDVQEEE